MGRCYVHKQSGRLQVSKRSVHLVSSASTHQVAQLNSREDRHDCHPVSATFHTFALALWLLLQFQRDAVRDTLSNKVSVFRDGHNAFS